MATKVIVLILKRCEIGVQEERKVEIYRNRSGAKYCVWY